jgi:hypothetical protein
LPRYIPATRGAQLFAALDSPGITPLEREKTALRLLFCAFSRIKSPFDADFGAIPFDIPERLT